MSFAMLKQLISRHPIHHTKGKALTSKFSTQLSATLGLAGAITLGTASVVTAAINNNTIFENLNQGESLFNNIPIEIANGSSLPTFSCTPNFYLSQADNLSSPSQLNDVTIDLNANPVFNLATIPAGINSNSIPYNAIGYNQKDDYLYGVENDPIGTNADHNVVRIGSDGSTEIVRTIPDPGNRNNGDILNYVVGDVIVDGGTAYLYASLGNLKTFYRVNLDDPSAPAEVITRTGDTTSIVDFAFHPTNGKLYGIRSDQHNQADRLVEITISGTTATVNTLTLSSPLPGNKFGGVFFDGNGTFYAYHNGDSGNNVNVPQANLYAIEIDEANNSYALTHLGEAANVNQNDGARCASAQPPAELTGLIPTGNPSLGGQVWDDTNFNGIQNAGEPGYDNVVVELLTTDGTVQDTQTTSGGGFYNFTNLAPDDYRVQFESPNNYIYTRRNRGNDDETDSDVNRTTGKTARITVAAGNNIDNLDAGILLDTEGDTIPDVVDGTGDRDGDGTPNYQDVDPAGYFYDEATGEIIAGGLVSVSGPGGINLAHDGNATGYYQWFIDGTVGTYNMAVTPPPGYQLSPTCLEQSTFDPTGGPDPTVVGNYEDGGNPGFLTSNECDPFYLSFDLADGDPFVINNNIPLTSISTPQNSSFCSTPYSMVYAGHFPNRIDAIHVNSGASKPLTTSNLASGTNSLASDHINKLVYYAENSAIYAWSPITNTHITITNNIFSFAGTGNISSLSSGAAAFYGGSLYLGVDEISHTDGAEIYRVDFIPGSNGQTIQSITSLNIGSLLIPSDWGDISIDNSGVMLGVAPGSFWTYDLNNGTYTQLSSSLPGDQHQLAQDGQGRLWAVVYTPSKFIMQVEVVGSTLRQIGSTISVDPHDTNDGAECVLGESSIGDRIWTDINGDDVQDTGESGIANVTVDLYWDIDGDGQIDVGTDPILATDTTDANGNYHFPDLILGDYIVQVTDNNGALTDTTLTSSTDTVAVTLPVGSVHFVEADVGYQPSATSPDVLLVKRITAINGNRTENPNDNTPLNTVVNDNVANSDDDHVNWPTSYLLGELNAGLVQPGDEIEYTVYFLNSGGSVAETVRICDWIQPNQTFATGKYGGNDIELVIGSTTYNLTDDSDAATVDRGEVTTVGSLPATPTCNLSSFSTTASDEVVVIDITGTTGDPTGLTTFPNTTGQGTPTNAYGYFRFTTKVDE